METINYTNVKINLPESLDDLTLKQYLDYSNISKDIKGDDESIENILRTYKVIEILTGSTEEEIDELLIDEVNDLSSKIGASLKSFDFQSPPSKSFTIDGVDYVAKDTASIDNGEYISMNILREQYKNDLELLPKLLAILIRPGKKEYDFEKKKEIWIVDKFNRRDIENLHLRADIFLNKAKAKDVIPVISFFLNGMQK
jgi:hypothetical protein